MTRYVPEVPIPVNDSLVPCPRRHPLFGLCCGPVGHDGNHAVWLGYWVTWTDKQSEPETMTI